MRLTWASYYIIVCPVRAYDSGAFPEWRTWAGRMKAATNQLSQRAIAERVGVSQGAVSHVLNGREHLVGAVVRARIRRALKECGYHRNALVRALQTNRTHVLGVIVPEALVSFFAEILTSVERAAKERQFQCFLCQSHNDMDTLDREIGTLREYRVDGLIIVAFNSVDRPEVYGALRQGHVPTVIVDCEIAGVRLPLVANDNLAIGRVATEHLVRLGHRRIACIQGYWGQLNARERVQGYRLAMREAGIAVDEAWVVAGGYEVEQGAQAVHGLRERGVDFTAVVACSDLTAIGVLQELRRQGRRVPEEVSVVGCGNLDMAAYTTPALTTVDQKPDELGRAAVNLLVKQIEAPPGRARKVATVLVEPALVVRESTAAPRA
jgi:LacI family transcriptional regulator